MEYTYTFTSRLFLLFSSLKSFWSQLLVRAKPLRIFDTRNLLFLNYLFFLHHIFFFWKIALLDTQFKLAEIFYSILISPLFEYHWWSWEINFYLNNFLCFLFLSLFKVFYKLYSMPIMFSTVSIYQQFVKTSTVIAFAIIHVYYFFGYCFRNIFWILLS